MKDILKMALYGAPRILGILFVFQISEFALVTLLAYPRLEVLMGLLAQMHWNIFLVIILALAWRWEWIGTLGFGAYAFWYLAFVNVSDTGTFLIMAGLPVLTAVLFFIGFTFKKDILE